MLRITDLAKNIDIFGRPLHLNFDKRWNTRDTSLGGISTAILFIFTISYMGLLFNIMVSYSQNTTSTIQKELILNDLGLIHLNETKILFFSWINGRLVDPKKPIEELFKYADIYFEE